MTLAAFLAGTGALLAPGAALALLLARLLPDSWPQALLSPFTDQLRLALLLGLLLLGAGVSGLPPWATLPPLALLLLLGLLLLHRAAPSGRGAPVIPARPGCVAVHYNVLRIQRDTRRAQAWLSEVDADLLFLVEASRAWPPVEAALAGRFPHRLELAYDRGWGQGVRMVLLSRHRLADMAPITVEAAERRALRATVHLPQGPLTFFGIHPAAPKDLERWRRRDLYLAAVAAEIAATRGPVLAMGDFNATPHDRVLCRFLASSGLAGPMVRGTWPSWPGPLGITIDHALAKGGACVLASIRGPRIGSDHRPIIAAVALPEA